MQGIPMVAVYLDDVLVSGRTPKEARANLLTVLSRLQTAGVRFRVEKCSFLCRVYLCHRLDAEGIHPTTDKLIALQNAPEPTSVSELRSYLGMGNYNHKFLKNVTTVFLQIVAERHVLVLGIRASKRVCGAEDVVAIFSSVLSQQMADGTYIPVTFTSRILAPAKKN